MTPVFITGFMGAGKTTIGKELGKRLGRKVLDTDKWVGNDQKKSIKQIFTGEGEQAFRRYETDALRKVTGEDVIVTTGGGIVTIKENRQWMNEHGTVIFLHCSLDELFQRLAADTERPLLKDKRWEDIVALLDKRLPFYEEADHQVDTSGKTIEQVVEEITGLLISRKEDRT